MTRYDLDMLSDILKLALKACENARDGKDGDASQNLELIKRGIVLLQSEKIISTEFFNEVRN